MTESRPELAISSLKITGYRSGIGNADRLLDSIGQVGLVHPVLITTGRMVLSGERRIWAYQKLGKLTIPVIYVRDIVELIGLMDGENLTVTGRLSKRRSEIAAQCNAIIEADLTIPRDMPSNKQQSPIRLLTMDNTLGVKDYNTLSGLLLMYRMSRYGLDSEDQALAYKGLDVVDDGRTSPVIISAELRRHLSTKYGLAKPTWRFVEQISGASIRPISVAGPKKIYTPDEQRQVLARTLAGLEGSLPLLDDIGPIDGAISVDEAVELRLRFNRAQAIIKRTISDLRGRIASE